MNTDDIFVEVFNAKRKEPTDGVDCPKCLNRGLIACIGDDGYAKVVECDCKKKRSQARLSRLTGIPESASKKMTFETFNVKAEWQGKMFERAENFLMSDADILFLGGQTGCGKTHLGVAASNAAVSAGIQTLMISWPAASKSLKSKANTPEYFEEIAVYKSVGLLFIDDFLSAGGTPSSADLSIAAEIVSERLALCRRMIICSPYTLRELYHLIPKVSGEIYERAKGFYFNIAHDISKDFRLKSKGV